MKKQNNESFSLEKKWLLEKGAVNLHAISKTGTRKFIAHFVAPTVLFPCNETAVSVGESELKEIDHLVSSDSWVLAFAPSFKEGIPPEGAITVGKSKVTWVCLKKGEGKLCGLKELTLKEGDCIPLTHGIWLEIDENTQIGQTSPGELDVFHRLFSLYIAHLLEQEVIEEQNRISQKKENDEAALNEAFLKMTSLLSPEVEEYSVSAADPLFLACQELGKALKISFVFPEGKETATLEEICNASKVRYRQVLLKGDWWHEDAGHLLAFRGNNPLALLNKSPGRYNIDPHVAKQISPIAYAFYQPLPDELKTGRDLLYFFFLRNKKEYFYLGIYGTIAALISLIPPFVISNLYNAVIPNEDLPLLYQLIFIMVAAGVSATLFTFFRSLLLVRLEGKMSHEVQTAIWDRLLKLPVSFFRNYSSGNLFYRISSFDEMRTMLSTRQARVILSGIFSSFYFIAMVFYSFRLAIVALFLTGIVLFITAIACKFKVRLEKKMLGLQTMINGILVETIGGISKLRVSGAEASLFSYWAKRFSKRKKLEMQAQHIQNNVIAANAILPFLSAAWIFLVAIGLEKRGQLSTWEFLAFDAAFIPFSMALYDLSNTLLTMTPILPLWDLAKVILEQPPEISVKKLSPSRLKGEISVDRLYFHYLPDTPILKDVSIQIAPGEFVGIVGPSGCGKSTLLRILIGFEKPTSGAVFFDSKDLATLDPYEVRKQLGVVLQNSNLISGSFFDNIVTGGRFMRDDVERAIQLSEFERDLENFPMGLYTVVNSGANTLSNGQKQRLLIARALVSRPKILFLDEATSALDNKSQDTVSRNIDALDVTRVVVAHRLSTLKHADRIYVLDKGEIVQQGTFSTLSAERGLFQNMLERQKV